MSVTASTLVRCLVLSAFALALGAGCTIEVVMKTGGGATGAPGAGGGGASGAPGSSGMSPGGALAECLPTETTGLTPCCNPYGMGHCLPDDQVPFDMVGHLAACDGGGQCVPDERILLGGGSEVIPCSSINGAPGACLSRCVPEIESNASYLPQDVCPPHLVCAPCAHPLTGENTGACDAIPTPACGTPEDGTGSDPGGDGGSSSGGSGGTSTPEPAPPPPPAPACCEGRASCVLASGIPAEHQSRLGRDTCADDRLCLPTELTDPTFVPRSCTIGWMEIFTPGSGAGGCLSDCIPETSVLSQEDCPAHYKCAPCTDPLSGMPTGACGPPMP